MSNEAFGQKLLVALLLLIGLSVLKTGVIALAPLLPSDFSKAFYRSSSWLCNLLLAVIILAMSSKKGKTGFSIAILTVALPAFGVLFYLLTSIINRSK